MAINGLVQQLCKEEKVGFVGQPCGEREDVHQRRPASEWKRAAVFADGLKRAVDSNVRYVK